MKRRLTGFGMALGLSIVGLVVVSPSPAGAGLTPGASSSRAAAGLTACQRRFPYSVSVLTPIKQQKSSNEWWAWGRVKLWDNRMDGCTIRVCIQQRESSSSSWYNASACWNYVLRYEGAPAVYESVPAFRFVSCSSMPAARDNVRTFTRNAESAVGSGRVSAEIDVCPGQG